MDRVLGYEVKDTGIRNSDRSGNHCGGCFIFTSHFALAMVLYFGRVSATSLWTMADDLLKHLSPGVDLTSPRGVSHFKPI